MARIHCLSTADMDRVFEVDHLPVHDEKMFATAFHEGVGGQGVFVARALAALGAPVTYHGTVGDDPTGAALVAELSAIAGLSVDITRLAGVATGTCAIIVDRTGEKALVLAPAAPELGSRLGEGLTVEPGDIVTLNFFDPPQMARVLARARADGATTIVDIEATGISVFGWDAALAVMAAADIVCSNQTTLDAWSAREAVTGALLDRAERFARAIAVSGQRVCVTLGAAGVFVFDGAATEHIPAVPVKPLNTTGAGDTFLAGLAFGLHRGDSLFDAARLATRVAADFLGFGRIDRSRLGL
ncbi:MAG TPA: PfkB family carbohydrate kinase [Kaistia sp.]|nr:PfkB family carbohydrate kinase [Kaistia sp.]